jgi:opacity protein-like surface antigen
VASTTKIKWRIEMKSVKYALMGLVVSTAAFATDLPSKNMPTAPFVGAESSSWYAGVAVGGITSQNAWYNNVRVNTSLGHELNSFSRVEATYDYKNNNRSENRSHTGMVNGIGQYKMPYFSLTPYALAGVGYRIADVKNEPVWNVGGGVRYDLTSNIGVDGRYRYLSDFNRLRDENIVTLGVNYKF